MKQFKRILALTLAFLMAFGCLPSAVYAGDMPEVSETLESVQAPEVTAEPEGTAEPEIPEETEVPAETEAPAATEEPAAVVTSEPFQVSVAPTAPESEGENEPDGGGISFR